MCAVTSTGCPIPVGVARTDRQFGAIEFCRYEDDRARDPAVRYATLGSESADTRGCREVRVDHREDLGVLPEKIDALAIGKVL